MKDYKKILEGVVDIINNTEKGDIGFVNICTYIGENCPELRESEGERIRKALIRYFTLSDEHAYKEAYGVSYRDIVAWLEKQGEQKPFDYENANIQQYDFAPKSALEAAKEEKVDSQNCVKPADKVEPKFKEGDWVVYECGEETATLQIIRIVGETYVFSDDSTLGVVDEDALRLWDIAKDAKNCDVLSDGTTIFVFKDLLSDGSVMSYCDYDADSGESDAFCPLSMNLMCSKITPATKEQREQLEKAMADAGYTFDFEKKELRKIDQKPAWWSEEDEEMLLSAIEYVCTFSAYRNSVVDWLKSLKDRYTWKPSDEQMKTLNKVIFCTYNANNIEDKKHIESLYNNLKKLTE